MPRKQPIITPCRNCKERPILRAPEGKEYPRIYALGHRRDSSCPPDFLLTVTAKSAKKCIDVWNEFNKKPKIMPAKKTVKVKQYWKKEVPFKNGWYWVKYKGKKGVVVCPAGFMCTETWGIFIHTARNDSFVAYKESEKSKVYKCRHLMIGSEIKAPPTGKKKIKKDIVPARLR